MLDWYFFNVEEEKKTQFEDIDSVGFAEEK
jgi:hypothetical protein